MKHKSKMEVYIDLSIPYLLVLLFILIILEIFYHDLVVAYALWIDLIDYLIITVFLIDLSFKYRRAKTWKQFLKTNWLDILAVVPFYLIFRLFEEITYLAKLGERFGTGQKVLHETVEVERIAAEVEKTGRVSRTRLFARFIKPLQRLPRFLKAFSVYEKP